MPVLDAGGSGHDVFLSWLPNRETTILNVQLVAFVVCC